MKHEKAHNQMPQKDTTMCFYLNWDVDVQEAGFEI